MGAERKILRGGNFYKAFFAGIATYAADKTNDVEYLMMLVSNN